LFVISHVVGVEEKGGLADSDEVFEEALAALDEG
jgi:hypothetical protein